MGLLEAFQYQVPAEMLARLTSLVNGLAGDPGASPVIQQGIVPSARLVMSAQPSNNDTIGIGATTFKFVSALGAAASQVQVLIGGSAAATLASLVKAINGTVSALEWVEATTPFAVTVLADAVSTSLRIRYASARGGNPIDAVSTSIALAEAITASADIWNAANLNVSGENSNTGQLFSSGQVTITAQMITNGSFDVELPFGPGSIGNFGYSVRTSTGAGSRATTDTVTASGSTLHISLAGSASPALQAGDIVSFWATT